MSLKCLATHEMLYISGLWIDPQSEAHQALLSVPELSPSVPRLTAAHHHLSDCAQPLVQNPRLAEISTLQAQLDHRHDAIIRGVHGLLTASAELVDELSAADLLKLRDTLIPGGLHSTRTTYLAEAGQALLLAGRLTPALRSAVDSFHFGPSQQHSLGHYIDEWIAVAERLGTLENEKARLQPGPKTLAKSAAGSAVVARNQWIREVNLLVANAQAAELAPTVSKLIFCHLWDAERKAKRRGSRSNPPEPTDPSAPKPR